MAHSKWALIMGSQRTHIILPEELIAEIDAMVGPRGRSAFLVETARTELRRRRLLAFLKDDQPAWTEANHPELAAGSGPWVKQLRAEGDKRLSKTARPAKKSK